MKLKLKIFAYGIAMSFCIASANAQTLKQTIRGRVSDVDTKSPLVGVTLYLEGSDPIVGTVTDPNGYFTFKQMPLGRYNIGINYVGYESKVIPNVLLGAGKEAYLEIDMIEEVTSIDEVVVKAKKNKGVPLNDMATVSARSFTVEETQRFAGSFADPSRMVSSYAGVVGDPDGNNSIIIRGNSPRGLLWRVEGIDVPNPNHFANEGSTGGPISILNSTTLANSDFLTGAFPAGYGDAYSGVFDIKLRNGNNEKTAFTAQAGVIGMEFAAEGPFSEDHPASYLVNYRYSSLALLTQAGIQVAGDAVPKYQDLTFNINIPTARFGNFQLFGISGISNIDFSDTNYQEDFMIKMGVMGLNHIYPLSKNTYLKSSLSGSLSVADWQSTELDSETNKFEVMNMEDMSYFNYRLATELTHKFSARNTVKVGASSMLKQYKLVEGFYDSDIEQMREYLNEDGFSTLSQAFINWKFRPTKNLTFNSGLNYTYLDLNKNKSLEPRMGLRWQINGRQAFTAGFGKHSRSENTSLYLVRLEKEDSTTYQPNKDLNFTKANHYVVGYEYRLTPNFNIKAEAYYQDLYDVPVEKGDSTVMSMLNETDGYIFTELVNKGTGTNYGVELTMEKFFSKNYYFLVTTSLYESKYTMGDDVKLNTRFNGNYVVNLVGGAEFPMGKNKNNALGVNLRGTVAGGQYYSPIDPVRSAELEYGFRPLETAYSKKRDDFVRVDLKVSFRRNKKKTTRVWELDIQNVTNTLNVTGDYWSRDEQKVVEYTQMGLLPVINYRIEF